MLDRDELPGYRVVVKSRVSNISKDSDSSLDRQNKQIQDEFQKLKDRHDAKLIRTFRLKESASSMDRESLDEILELAKESKFDILMVWAIHRLTRASFWETVEYLLKLRKYGIVIYSDRDGYFSWDDPNDALRLIDRIVNAREWRDEIVRGAVEGRRAILEDGHWPYGSLAYGLVDDEEQGIIVRDGWEWIPETASSYFTACQDTTQTTEYLQQKIQEKDFDAEFPSEDQVERMLSNELFIGRLTLKQTGEVVREKDDLKVIPPEIFDEVQEILQESDDSETNIFRPQVFPDFIYELITRFGQEFVVDNIAGIRWCCPECQSVDINISDTTIEYWGISLPKIYCKESGCGYIGPVVRLKELNEIDSTLPFVCPECQRTDGFVVEELTLSEDDSALYKYTCDYCDEFMIKNKGPNTYQRARESAVSINLRGKHSSEAEENRTNPAVFDAIGDWLYEHGNKGRKVRDVLVSAAKILDKDGPLDVAELRDRLWTIHSDKYSSPRSLYYSVIQRYHEETPGFEKPSRGKYDFNPEPLEFLLEWSPDDAD